MFNESQVAEKKKRIKLVVDTFLSYEDITINELSKILNISSSTIQRDLNDVEYIHDIYEEKTKDILTEIREKLKNSKKKGLSRGGINSTTSNEPIRDENGKFTGNRKK